jgi:hypothetical protein
MKGECRLSGVIASFFAALLVNTIALALLFKGKEDQDYVSRLCKQDR